MRRKSEVSAVSTFSIKSVWTIGLDDGMSTAHFVMGPLYKGSSLSRRGTREGKEAGEYGRLGGS